MDSGDLFQRNMNYVREHSSSISYKILANAPADTEKLEVMASENGKPLFYAHSGVGKVLLHSKRDPMGEASRQIEQWEGKSPVDWNSTVLIFGFAGMHHVLKFQEKMGPSGTLIVIDCIPEIFRKTMQFCDLREFEKNPGNIIFIVSDNPESAARELRHYLKLKLSVNTSLFTHPGIFRCFSDIYNAFYERIITEIRTETVDRGTKAEMSDEWIQNAMLNLSAILRGNSINIFRNIFKGRTALMVAAGPSLNYSLEYIKKVSEKYIIFCVGTALGPLLKAGIEPDFIVVIDCDPLVMKQFSTLQIPEKSILLTAPIVFPELINQVPLNRLAFFDIGLPCGFNKWLSSVNASLDTLSVGGTVSLSTIDAAVYCGCEKIIFCGLDLAFLDDGTTHASNSMYDGQKDKKEDLVKVKGNFGKDVLTSGPFSTYISMINAYLEDTLNNKNVKFYNSVTGGAFLRNTSVISPEDMLALDNSDENVDKNDLISASLANSGTQPEEKVLSFLNSTMTELAELRDTAEKAENASEIMFRDEENIKYTSLLSAELEKLDRKIREKNNASLLVNSALQPLFMNIFSIGDAETHENSAMNKNKRFYSHLKGAADWIYGLVDIAVKAYKNKHNLKIGSVKT